MTGSKIGEVSLFDLVKTSLRYRPDFLVVGEVRGEEAFVLFQAVATGHGGLCTIHGESFDSAVKRLTSPPMNVAESYIPLMNVAIMLERVMLPKTVAGVPFGRRITTVWEVEDFNKYVPVFEWSPTEDLYYNYTKRSVMLHRFAYRTGRSFGDMLEEIQKRRALLRWLQSNNIRNVKEVYKYVTEYYVDGKGLFRRLNIEVEPVSEVPTVEGAGTAAIEPGIPKVGERPPVPMAAVAPTLKFLESGSFKILKALSEADQPVDQNMLLQSSGMDQSEFEKILGILTKIGHATVQQKSDKGGFKTLVEITPQGKKAYAQLSKKSSEL
jgi:flagellar protein FlaI